MPKFKAGTPQHREFMRTIGRKGGKNNFAKRGREGMAEIGRRGGESVVNRFGRGYYSRIRSKQTQEWTKADEARLQRNGWTKEEDDRLDSIALAQEKQRP